MMTPQQRNARKRKKPTRQLSKKVASDRLIRAVAKWVDANNGRALVAGGISIETWPGDHQFNFYVRVKVTGRKPEVSA